MNVIYLLVPIALLLGFGFVWGFIWMTANGQYDDLETPAYRILSPDEPIKTASNERDLKP